MAVYKPGVRYVRNVDTLAVFNYRERIADLSKMEVVIADDDGNLVKESGKPKAVELLNPTDTPEKQVSVPREKPPAPAAKQPTMKPVEA